ncbi:MULTISPECIES: TIM barrel protein [unclassified Crossiella]|uniref:TIM barrel protein n=1 Tax=unclassified Crossiella TaxID=2620835 RepID=UPI001FFFB2CA|nr:MULTISPECIES: TIM barrel protein [unclassified Crossiella]MCK2236540.1 sugar phosphate isomerase/epimerase [Crossiella sp. S99.2]MCK2250207.1 sugar phosphate isomerase/epimerase [Crossiella sp. S99.1]
MIDADTVLGEMAALGLTATELGPPEYLPTDPAKLRELLGGHRLSMIGGFLAVVLHENSVEQSTVDEAERTAALLAATGAEVLVLAAATGLDGYDERPALTDAEWATLIRVSGRIRDIAARHGLRTVLHPHVGTHIERKAEVERFLADSDLELCLDTGHLLIGGTDPVELAREHAGRIGHMHLKDVRAEVAARVRDGELPYATAVGQGLYVPLGDGDVDIAGIVRFLRDAGYQGWYVLEQDTALAEGDADAAARPKKDTARSLDHLRPLFG